MSGVCSFFCGLWIAEVCCQPPSSLIYRKCLGTCDANLCDTKTLQSALEMGQEEKIVQNDFSAAFERVYHQRILFKLCAVGVKGSVLSVLTEFL